MEGLNWWAIVLAALCASLLGGSWYSNALFGRAWNREANDSRPPGSGHPAKVFGGCHTAQFLLFGLVLGLWH